MVARKARDEVKDFSEKTVKKLENRTKEITGKAQVKREKVEIEKRMIELENELKVYEEQPSRLNRKDRKFDFFISHASEEKKVFVDELVSELEKGNGRCWYDKRELQIGAPLEDEILNGLKNSEYVIVVLSKNYFQKEWTQKELEIALKFDENVKKEKGDKSYKVILPIWYDVDAKYICENYVSEKNNYLANIMAIKPDCLNIEKISKSILKILND